MTTCPECHHTVEDKEMVRIPEMDGEFDVCRACFNLFEDMIELVIKEGIEERVFTD